MGIGKQQVFSAIRMGWFCPKTLLLKNVLEKCRKNPPCV